MSFRSAAVIVVARIFKLVDSNGFTRLFFGPFTVLTHLGYALRYEDPAWTDPDTETGIWFGTDSAPDTSETDIYAIGKNVNTNAHATVSTVNTGVTTAGGVVLRATEDSGTVHESSISVNAVSLPAGSDSASILLNCLRAAVFAQIEIKVPATGIGDILIVADRLGPWNAFAYAANFANLGGGTQVMQYRRVGDIVHLRGYATTTGVTAATPTVGTLPAGFRPPVNGLLDYAPVDTAGVITAIRVDPSGAVSLISGALGAGNNIPINIWFCTSA